MDHLGWRSLQATLEQVPVVDLNVATTHHIVNAALTNTLLDTPACRVGVPGQSWR
jgi:hypothetical protein